MRTLGKALDDYLELRRALGFKLQTEAFYLGKLLVFLKEKRCARITTALALEFATGSGRRTLATKRGYMGAVRGVARYLAGMGWPVEIPPSGLFGSPPSRIRPYIYSDAQINRLLEEVFARWHSRRYSLKPWTMHGIIGLLAATGMRLGEVLKLEPRDIDWNEGVLTVRNAKFLKSRLVPLHPSSVAQLRAYAGRRDEFFAKRARAQPSRFFATSRGNAILGRKVSDEFRELLERVGLRAAGCHRGPRLHDLRHRFAVMTLLRWYRNAEPVERLLPVLSTYLGHSHVTGTYWYLRCTPELMVAAGARLENRWEGVVHASQR